MVKIPKIKDCNPSPFRKSCLETSLTKQSHVLFEITFYVFFSFSHICNSLFRITDEVGLYKICIFLNMDYRDGKGRQLVYLHSRPLWDCNYGTVITGL